jgi:hypothetical protein
MENAIQLHQIVQIYVSKIALTDSTKFLFHNVLLVLLNAQLAVVLQLTVLHVFMDLLLLLELAV